MRQINIIPSAKAIENIAEQAEQLSHDLRRVAMDMRNRNNPEYAADALNSVVNFVSSCRLDLLITRPLRECLKENK